MKIQEIVKKISELRKTRKPFVSNYYLSLQNSDKDFETWISDSSIVFCDSENDLLRCYFATIDLQDLNTLLENVPSGAVMDYIIKENISEFSWTDNSLFRHYTTLVRHTCADLCGEHEKTKHELFMEQFYEENFGEFATEKDAEELYEMLYQIFDFRVSRLPSMEELTEMIHKNWVLLYREKGEVIAFLMYQIEGRKYYGYQIYNSGTADISYNLERRAVEYAKEHYGVTSSYSWTETDNLGANQRAGECDGTYDYIFVKE